jgi:shikimate dehydrogenase
MTSEVRPPEFGLIGYPLGHTFSPGYFTAKFAREGIDARYEALPLERITDLPALLKSNPQLRGLNVTTPHKGAVISYLDNLSDDAAVMQAVNCIAIRDGQLAGYNTDWIGFSKSLEPLLQRQHSSALVLGNGGAANAVRYALGILGISFKTITRKADEGNYRYDALTADIIKAHPLIINATTLGTNGEGLPRLPYSAIDSRHLLYDLVYNPPITPFLEAGMRQGAIVKNGQEMLERQAEAAWQIWQGADLL